MVGTDTDIWLSKCYKTYIRHRVHAAAINEKECPMNAIERMTSYLSERHIPFNLISHSRTGTSRQAAMAAGVDSHRMVKAVLLESPDCYSI